MKTIRKIYLAALALVLLPLSAVADVVDFQDVPSSSCYGHGGGGITSGGFNFTGNPDDPNLYSCDAGVLQNNTSAALINANDLSILIMSQASGGSFTLQSFFAGSRTAAYATSTQQPDKFATGIDILGNLAGGGSVFQHFDFNYLDWDQFLLSNDFSQALTSVVFTAVGGADRAEFLIDDIVVNAVAVPEPGTLVLLGLGLAGIGFAKRKNA